MAEDDFGKKQTMQEEKNFSKGDRIVFTRNTQGLGVKNGTMGTITDLNKQTIQVKLDEGKEISFAPNLNPYFDQGWAITIHKSQGTTVNQTYLLASYEMTQNLAYVAMTRHRENVHVFGSSLDFWRPEKLPEVLSKSGEKLSAADYLDADSLNKLMQKDDHLLTKIFERVSNELDAMGAVSKKAFWQVADHFLGIQKEKEIRIAPDYSKEGVREETRAEAILKTKAVEVKDTISHSAGKKLDCAPLATIAHENYGAVPSKRKENETSKSYSENLSQVKLQEPTESNFTKLVHLCEQRLHDNLKHHNMALTPERAHRHPHTSRTNSGLYPPCSWRHNYPAPRG